MRCISATPGMNRLTSAYFHFYGERERDAILSAYDARTRRQGRQDTRQYPAHRRSFLSVDERHDR